MAHPDDTSRDEWIPAPWFGRERTAAAVLSDDEANAVAASRPAPGWTTEASDGPSDPTPAA